MRSISPFVLATMVVAAPLAAQDAKPELKPPVTLTAADSARFLELGKTYTRWFVSGKADSLLTAIHPDRVERLGGLEGIRTQQDQISERAGVQVRITEEKLTRRLGQLQYWHSAEFSDLQGDELVIRWLLDENGKIIGAGVGPRRGAPPVD